MPTLPFDILFEDNHLVAVNKPAGELVQGDNTGDTSVFELVKQYIKEKYNKPGEVYLGLVHRLDRPVSGVLLFARTSKAAARLQKVFQQREVEKVYRAVVEGRPSQVEGNLTHYLVRNRKKNRSNAFSDERPESQKAVLEYNTLAYLKPYSLLEIQLHTGRHHQIRAQLAAIGCPIVGDLKYGSKTETDGRSICLHAMRLSLIHPVRKEPLTLESLPPKGPYWNQF